MKKLYGRYAIFSALEGKGNELAEALISNTEVMKQTGALIYTVGFDAQDIDSVHVYAVWASESDKAASFSHSEVAATVEKAALLIRDRPVSKDLIVFDD